MDKITYLAELAEALARWVPERERQDILRYYAEYFAEAGPGKEAEVIQELGDPWALSCRLAVEGGFVTQEAANNWKPPKQRKVWPLVLAGSLAAMVIVAVSVASLASQVGRIVGRMVGYCENEVAVAAEPEWMAGDIGFATVEDIPGMTAIGGTDIIYSYELQGGFWSAEDGTLDAFDSIDVDISFGSITIHGGEDYTLFIQQEGDLGGYELKWEVTNGTLKIQDAKRGGFQVGFSGLTGRHSLDVIITVPDMAMLEKIDVETALGDLFLGSLNVSSKVEASTALGDIGCYEVYTPSKLTLKSNLGDLTFGSGLPYSGMCVELETNLGDIEASLSCYEVECEYELKTDLGEVTINGVDQGNKAVQKGDYAYKLTAGSNNGDVAAYFYDSRWQ